MFPKKTLILGLLLAGCSQAHDLAEQKKPAPQVRHQEAIKAMNVISGQGEVRLMPLEGGFYGIVADDGKRWLPLGLPKAFQRPGLKVHFSGTPKPDLITIQQWGTPLQITDIKALPGQESDQEPGGRDETH